MNPINSEGTATETHRNYKTSLVASLAETTHKMAERVQRFQLDFPELGSRFVFGGYV